MAVKDEKMADADAEQDKRKKQKLKKKGAKGEDDKEADLSEEDLELKKNLELMLERAKDSDAGVQRTALEGIAKEIRYVEQDYLCVQSYVQALLVTLTPRVAYGTLSSIHRQMSQGIHNIDDICPKAPEVSAFPLQGAQGPV